MDYSKFPIRKCRSRHACSVCETHIIYGEKYYDGGYRKKTHVKCVKSNPEPKDYPCTKQKTNPNQTREKMENINFGPEEFKLLETKYPAAFWEMVASVKIRENKELRKAVETKSDVQ